LLYHIPFSSMQSKRNRKSKNSPTHESTDFIRLCVISLNYMLNNYSITKSLIIVKVIIASSASLSFLQSYTTRSN
jgi:hypothetical protein